MEEATTSSSSSVEMKEYDRGAGGKIKKKTPFLQRPPPYARPPPPQKRTGDGGGRWWKSASRIISSFFSKSPLGGSGDASNERDIQTAQSLEVGEAPLAAGNTLQRHSIVNEVSDVELRLEGKTISGQVPLVTEVPKPLNSESGNTISRPSAGNEISEIEERLEGKTLSRDEFDRLKEILESRVAAQSDGDEYGNRVLDSATQPEAVVASLSQDKLKGSDDKKEVVYLNRARGESSNSFLNSSPGDLVGASPIDIAKAYMGTRTSELGVVSQSKILQGDLTPISTKGFVSHSSALSPRPKSSVCWPGAMVQESYSYLTPQTQTGRPGIHTSQRTPYSRPIHSRSTSKLKGDADRPCNILSTNMKQLQSPVYGGSQVPRTSISSLNDGLGSAGPIRRARRKFHGAKTPSSSKGMSSSRPTTPFWDEGLDASNNLLPMVKQYHEPGPSASGSSRFQPVNVKTPSNLGYSSVHPQSTDMARKILEHLDRTIPTPEKKSAELKLATSWRTAPSSISTTSLVEAPVNPLLECSEKEVRANAQLPKGKADVNAERTRSLGSSVLSKEISSGAIAVPLDKNVSTELKKSTESKTNKDEITGVAKKPPAHTFGNKPSLASISVVDPKARVVNMRAAYNNNNGLGGFTFPVSAVGSLSEPPTPSVTPFSPIIAAAKPKENSLMPPPSYSFGGRRGQALVFSFPCSSSSSSAAAPSEFSAPKFTFGSNKARLCFRPVVEDAVC